MPVQLVAIPEPVDKQPSAVGKPVAALLFRLVIISSLALISCEAFWRLAGLRPQSDILAFGRLRQQVDQAENAVALVGSSRILCDVDPEVLNRSIRQRRFFQLAINGASPFPVLQDLALDQKFRGAVICEFSPKDALAAFPFTEAPEHLNLRRRQWTGRLLESWLNEYIRDNFAFRSVDRWYLLGQAIRRRAPIEGPRKSRFFPQRLRGKDNSLLIQRWTQVDRRAYDLLPANGNQRVLDQIP